MRARSQRRLDLLLSLSNQITNVVVTTSFKILLDVPTAGYRFGSLDGFTRHIHTLSLVPYGRLVPWRIARPGSRPARRRHEGPCASMGSDGSVSVSDNDVSGLVPKSHPKEGFG